MIAPSSVMGVKTRQGTRRRRMVDAAGHKLSPARSETRSVDGTSKLLRRRRHLGDGCSCMIYIHLWKEIGRAMVCVHIHFRAIPSPHTSPPAAALVQKYCGVASPIFVVEAHLRRRSCHVARKNTPLIFAMNMFFMTLPMQIENP